MSVSVWPPCLSLAFIDDRLLESLLRRLGIMLRMVFILDNGFVGGGIKSRLEGATWILFACGGDSTFWRLSGRLKRGLKDGLVAPAWQEVCADLPAVCVGAVCCCSTPASSG